MQKQFKEKLRDLFGKKTVLTFKDVKKQLRCSRPVFDYAIRQLGYRSSCNQNGRYYILKESCELDNDGIYRYRDIIFSAQGTLKNTVFHMVENSISGVASSDVEKAWGASGKVVLSKLHTSKMITRQIFNGRFVYLSTNEEVNHLQRKHRASEKVNEKQTIEEEVKEVDLPPLLTIISILTVLAQQNNLSAKQVHNRLMKKGVNIPREEIKKVMSFYNIPEKKT
ncbi:MAG: hypothetical protein JXR53_09355 [Bacteroidales bacterium]|nr:hypothetical protein [Bacteroidales bacterium]